MSATAKAAAASLSDRIVELLQHVRYRSAETDDERAAIFRLRYEAYLREGVIQPSFGRTLSDPYDDSENAWIVGVHVDNRLVASMRIHVGTQDYPELVATQVFPEYVLPELEAGKVVIDPTRFVVDASAARTHPELSYVTVRIGHMAAEHFASDIVLASVRSEHQAFYRRVFGHYAVCEPRPYLGLLRPLSLMMLDYPAERDRIVRRFPFFSSTPVERAALFGEATLPHRQVAAKQAGDAALLVG
jgi:N-acyl-L-homoserine lactone synthetase